MRWLPLSKEADCHLGRRRHRTGGGIAVADRATGLVGVRTFDPEHPALNRRYIILLEQEAARRYHAALSARLAADIRTGEGAADQDVSGRLTWTLAWAARRWERTLIALDRPLPAGLQAATEHVTPPPQA